MSRYKVMMLATAMLMAFTWLPAHAEWSIDWHSLDGGGTLEASADNWELKGTIGQPDATPANALSGEGWTLAGGFWALFSESVDRIFRDRFQTN